MTFESGREFELEEVRALGILRRRYTETENNELNCDELAKLCDISDRTQSRILFDRLIALGAIEPWTHRIGSTVIDTGYRITPRIIEIESQRKLAIESLNAPDRVESATRWARSQIVLAFVIIAVLSTTVLVTLANQLIELIKNISELTQ
jgi:hypothetical protein